jgi:hypothetical protein
MEDLTLPSVGASKNGSIVHPFFQNTMKFLKIQIFLKRKDYKDLKN